MNPSRAASGAALLLVSLARPAAAQTQTDAAREEARRRFAHAVELMQSADWNSAIPELERVRAVMETLPVLYNLGLAHRAVGHVIAARSALRTFLENGGDSLHEERRREVEAFLTALDASVARLTLDVQPASCMVSIDGREGSHPGDRIDLDPGDHALVARCDGYQPDARTVTLAAGASQTVTLRPVALPRVAALRVDASVAGASISIDGLAVGTGRAMASLAPGRHRVDVAASGYRPWRRDVPLDAGRDVSIRAELQAIPWVQRPLFWGIVGGVVAAAAVTTTVVLLVGAESTPPVTPAWGVVRTP